MFLTAIKIFGILFPFIRELFFGKNETRRKGRIDEESKPMMKKAIIIAGIASFIVAIFAVKRVVDLSLEVAEYRRKEKGAIAAAQAAASATVLLPPSSGIPHVEVMPEKRPTSPASEPMNGRSALPGPQYSQTRKKKSNDEKGQKEPNTDTDEFDSSHRQLIDDLKAIQNVYHP